MGFFSVSNARKRKAREWVKENSPYGLVIIVFGMALLGAYDVEKATGLKWIQEVAFSTLLLLLVDSILNISRELRKGIIPKYFVNYYHGAEDAMIERAGKLAKSDSRLELYWLGASMNYGLKYFQKLKAKLDKVTVEHIEISIVMLDPKGKAVTEYKNGHWAASNLNGLKDVFEEWGNDFQGLTYRFSIYLIDEKPAFTGLLLNHDFLYLNYSMWNDDDNKLSSGEVEYVVHDIDNEIGQRRIASFTSWFKNYCRDTKSRLEFNKGNTSSRINSNVKKEDNL